MQGRKVLQGIVDCKQSFITSQFPSGFDRAFFSGRPKWPSALPDSADGPLRHGPVDFRRELECAAVIRDRRQDELPIRAEIRGDEGQRQPVMLHLGVSAANGYQQTAEK